MGFFRKAVLLEAGAAILFFGALAGHPELERSGAQALRELQALGYRTPSVSEPVRVYPAKTGAAFTAGHAGGWHPGVISLREDPAGPFGPEIYLRHELMHEAGHRTCARQTAPLGRGSRRHRFQRRADGPAATRAAQRKRA